MKPPPTDYQRIAQAITYIQEQRPRQPDLATIAQVVGLSEYHFQRLFTQWAGISPKRFWQYLTVEYAKAKITETQNLLDLTLDVGLSSPGRLHDLFVTLEAMSPGEFKAGGAGLQIQYGIHETPFGAALIATTQRGICNLHFLDYQSEQLAAEILHQQWPTATLHHEPNLAAPLCARIFQICARIFQIKGDDATGGNAPSPLKLRVKGTNFQIQVWRALLDLPLGRLTSYQSIATQLGQPNAARAVGTAIGRNPVGFLIPCHRVLRTSGELGGYRWGLLRKTVMLGWEASQTVGDE
jgi:AraC family transcriptional regulator of adaptative response/methylated-DNA-[protein]-cysteine methyltransferase